MLVLAVWVAVVLGLFACLAVAAKATNLSPDNAINWPGRIPFVNPQAIAIDPSGTRVYVADTGRDQIDVFSDGGLPIRSWYGRRGPVTGRFSAPTGVAVDRFGFVYVADSVNGQVVKFNANGKPIGRFALPFVYKLAISGDRVFALTTFFDLVAVRSTAGDDLGAWRATFPGRYWFYQGYDDPTNDAAAIATDPQGRVLVAGISSQALSDPPPDCHTVPRQRNWPDPLRSGEITEFNGGGGTIGAWWLNGSRTDCAVDPFSFGKPRGVAVDPNDGQVYAADHEHTIDNLTPPPAPEGSRGFSISPKLPCPQCSPDPAAYFSTEPIDLAFDCRSDLYVLTPDRVIKYLSPPGAPGRTCPRPPRIVKRLTFGGMASPTKHGFKLDLDCTAARCAGLLDVVAQGAGCQGNCRVARHFRIRRGREQAITLRPNGLLLGLIRRGLPLRLIATAHVGGQRIRGVARLRRSSAIRLSCSTGQQIGDSLSVSGRLGPGLRGQPIEVSYTGGGTLVQHLVRTGARGAWSDSFAPAAAGTWAVDVEWRGSHRYLPAHSGCESVFSARASALALDCPFGPNVFVEVGVPYTFTGRLTPAAEGSRVAITYQRPSESDLVHTVTTDAAGNYSDTITAGPNDAGSTWTVYAHFDGDETRAPADTPTCAAPVH